MPSRGEIPTTGLMSLLVTAHREGLTGTIQVRPTGSGDLFFMALSRGELTAAWGGGAEDDPTFTAGAFEGGVNTEGDRAFLRAMAVDDGHFEVTTGEVLVAASARVSKEVAALIDEGMQQAEDPSSGLGGLATQGPGSDPAPMPLKGEISQDAGVDQLMAAAHANRFTGTVVIRPRYSSSPFSVGLERGQPIAAWGSGADRNPEETSHFLSGVGDPDNQGDRAYASLVGTSRGTYEATPGEPDVPASARLSPRLQGFIKLGASLIPWGPARFAPPAAPLQSMALSGVIASGMDPILVAAHIGRLTGTMEIRPEGSRTPFYLGLVDGDVTGAWGGGAQNDPSFASEMVKLRGWPDNAGDRAFLNVTARVSSGSYEVTPGEPQVPDSARVSPEAAEWLETLTVAARYRAEHPERLPTRGAPDSSSSAASVETPAGSRLWPVIVSLVLAMVAAFLLFAGALLTWAGVWEVGIPCLLAGIVAMVFSVIIYRNRLRSSPPRAPGG